MSLSLHPLLLTSSSPSFLSPLPNLFHIYLAAALVSHTTSSPRLPHPGPKPKEHARVKTRRGGDDLLQERGGGGGGGAAESTGVAGLFIPTRVVPDEMRKEEGICYKHVLVL